MSDQQYGVLVRVCAQKTLPQLWRLSTFLLSGLFGSLQRRFVVKQEGIVVRVCFQPAVKQSLVPVHVH